MTPKKWIIALERSYPEAKHLLRKDWREENEASGIPSTGHCYIATEALYHLLGGKDAFLRPMVASYIENGRKCTHWWLYDTWGNTLDPTRSQYGEEEPPYHLGRRGGFLNGFKTPSKRASALMEIARGKMSALLNELVEAVRNE